MMDKGQGVRDRGSEKRAQGSASVKFATLVFFEKFNRVKI
jgi:hypothetical protein